MHWSQFKVWQTKLCWTDFFWSHKAWTQEAMYVWVYGWAFSDNHPSSSPSISPLVIFAQVVRVDIQFYIYNYTYNQVKHLSLPHQYTDIIFSRINIKHLGHFQSHEDISKRDFIFMHFFILVEDFRVQFCKHFVSWKCWYSYLETYWYRY